MTRILEWLQKRRENKALSMINAHLSLALAEAKELLSFIDGEGGYEKIDSLEKEADRLRRRIMDELARGELRYDDREDMMHLAKRTDVIADWINETGRDLNVFFSSAKLSAEEKKILREMCRNSISAVSVLNQSFLELLAGNKEKAMGLTHKVEELEEDVDRQYADVKRLVLRSKRKPPEIFLLYTIFSSMENAADSCEDVADMIRLMLVRVW